MFRVNTCKKAAQETCSIWLALFRVKKSNFNICCFSLRFFFSLFRHSSILEGNIKPDITFNIDNRYGIIDNLYNVNLYAKRRERKW